MRNEFVYEIAKPPEAIHPYLVDHDLLKVWMEDLVESVATSPGGPKVGATYRQTWRMGKRTFPMEGEVTVYDPPTSFAYRGNVQGCDVTGTFRLERTPTGTRLVYVEESQMKGFFARLLAPLFAGMIKKRVHAAFRKLKQVVEAA